MRFLGLAVAVSILATGVLGLAASRFETARAPVSLDEAIRAPEGTRLFVRGLLEDVRVVSGGAAVASLTDCAGSRATVFFESDPPTNLSWRLVTLDATVRPYRGVPELVASSGAAARAAAEPYAVVEPEALAAGWRALLCRPIALHAPVLSAHPDEEDPKAVALGVFSGLGEVRIVLHADVYLEVTLEQGAVVTFLGVVAASKDGALPVLHVRV